MSVPSFAHFPFLISKQFPQSPNTLIKGKVLPDLSTAPANLWANFGVQMDLPLQARNETSCN